ncbi:MAG TPA: ABC transporter ATP-binding protein, partial [Pirellulales bacterium]|nr:ABC transporter ATP-binding protein [Pirellulales bacterium]
LTDAAKREITEVIERHHGQLKVMENPTTTLEELFLAIVRDSEARPGRRAKIDTDSAPDPSPPA